MPSVLVLHADSIIGQCAVHASKARGYQVYEAVTKKAESCLEVSLETWDEIQVRNLLAQFMQNNIVIDYLVTCPTRHLRGQALKNDDWDQVQKLNFISPFLFCKIFSAPMLKRKQGRIIQVICNNAIDPVNPRHVPTGAQTTSSATHSEIFAACMGGMLSLSRHYSAQFLASGVLSNNLVIGALQGFEDNDFLEQYVKRVPLAKPMSQEHLVNALDLLLDQKNTYMTGQNIIADGGVAIW